MQGRICLYGCLVFGIGNLLLLKLVHPLVVMGTAFLPAYVLHIFMVAVLIAAGLDVVYTTMHMTDFNEKLKAIQENISESIGAHPLKNFASVGKNVLADFSVSDYINLAMVKEKFKKQELRILRAFPSFHSLKYENLVEKIKETIKEIRK